MRKYETRRKTCYIPNNFSFDDNSNNELFINLLKHGFCHFYLTANSENHWLIEYLLKLKERHKHIKIFIVHNLETPFWKNEHVINLPIFVDNKKNEQSTLDQYLEKNCDKMLKN